MSHSEEARAISLVKHYESMLADGRAPYLDYDDFLMVIDFYLDMEPLEALKAVEFAGGLYPDDLILQLKRAEAFICLGELDKAQTIIDESPECMETSMMQASLWLEMSKQGQPTAKEKADALLSELMNQAGEALVDCCWDVSDIYYNSECYEESLAVLEKALSLDAQNKEFYLNAADCCEKLERFQQAIEFYQKWLDIDPYDIDSWMRVASNHLLLQQYEPAIEALKFADAVQTEEIPDIRLQMADLYRFSNSLQEALSIYKDIEEHYGDDYAIDLSGRLAECYELMGEYEQAIVYFRKRLEAFPDEEWTQSGLIGCLRESGHLDEAIAYSDSALAQHPESASLWRETAQTYYSAGLFAIAEMACRKLLDLDNSQAKDWALLSCLLFEQSHYAEALDCLQKVVELGVLPKSNAYMAVCLHQLGRTNEAQSYLQHASEDERSLFETIINALNEPDTHENTSG